jgi:hypothetical protein
MMAQRVAEGNNELFLQLTHHGALERRNTPPPRVHPDVTLPGKLLWTRIRFEGRGDRRRCRRRLATPMERSHAVLSRTEQGGSS